MEKRSAGQSPQWTDWQGQDSQGQGSQGVGSQGQNREGGRTYYTGLSSIKEGEKVRYYLYNHRGDTVLVTGGDGEIIHNLSYEAYGKATDKLGYPAGSVNIETGGESGAGGGSGVNGGSESFGGGAGSSGATSGGAGSSGGRGSVFPQLFAGAYGIRYDAKANLHYMRYRWYSQTQMRFISLDLIRNANRYSYTNGNPIMFVDPTGLEPENIEKAENDIEIIYWYPKLIRKDKGLSKNEKELRKIILQVLKDYHDDFKNSENAPILTDYGQMLAVLHKRKLISKSLYEMLENMQKKAGWSAVVCSDWVQHIHHSNDVKNTIISLVNDEIEAKNKAIFEYNTGSFNTTINMILNNIGIHYDIPSLPLIESINSYAGANKRGHEDLFLRINFMKKQSPLWITTETNNASGSKERKSRKYYSEIIWAPSYIISKGIKNGDCK